MSDDGDLQSDRRSAVIVGVLFLIALVLYLIGALIYGPSTGSDEFLDRAYPERTTVALGLLVEFVAVLAIPFIGYFMFPVLKRSSEALALAYAGLRSLEAAFLIAIGGKRLALIDVSETHMDASESDGTGLQALGDSLIAEADRLFTLYVLVFVVGALIFYALLYRARLVPRWLSLWGFASAAWMLVGTVLAMLDTFSGFSGAVEAIFVLPLPLNELALAFWLIFKGFDRRSPSSTAAVATATGAE